MGVWLCIIHETVGEQYPDDLLHPLRFWSAPPMDTLLLHEAAGPEKHQIKKAESGGKNLRALFL